MISSTSHCLSQCWLRSVCWHWIGKWYPFILSMGELQDVFVRILGKKTHSPAISVGSAKAIILDTKISLTLTKSYIPCMNISSFTADSTDQRPTVAWPYDVCCQQCRTSNEVCNDLKNINDTDIWCRNCPQWILSVWSPKKFFHSVHSSL